MSDRADERYYGLDLLRFIAAGLVVFFHYAFLSWAAPYAVQAGFGHVPRFPELGQIASVGWVGVEVFFVISGFVIAYSARAATPAQFFRGRVLRLLPALWLAAPATASVLLLSGAGLGDVLPMLARSVVLFPTGPWVDGVYWTLCLEIVFYGTVFLLLMARRPHWLEGFAIVMGIVSSLACLAALAPGPVGQLFARAVESWPLRLLELRNGCEFALGVLLYCLVSKPMRITRMLLIVLFTAGSLAEIWMLMLSESPGGGTPAGALAAMLLWLACMALFTLAILPGASRVIRTAGLDVPFARLGELTYPLYLSHQVVGWALLSAIYARYENRWIALGLTAVLAIGLTLAIVRIEPLVRRALDAGLRLTLPAMRPATRAASVGGGR